MNNRIIASITLTSFLSLGFPAIADTHPPAAASASQTLATVEAIEGAVTVNGVSLDDASPALGPSAVIRTGPEATAIVVLGNGSRLRLGANTEVRLADVVGQAQVVTGRVMGVVQCPLRLDSTKAMLTATKGEFVLSCTSQESTLNILGGDAALQASASESLAYEGLNGLDAQAFSPLTHLASMFRLQSTVAYFGGGKGKGLRVRNTTTNESVGGLEDASPDQDVIKPGPKPPTVTEVPPTPPPVTPPPVTPPPVTPPTTPPTTAPTAPAAVAGGGSALWPVLGVLAIGGIVAGVASSDGDNEEVVITNQPAPSPSRP